MDKKSANVPAAVVTGLLCLALGGTLGFYTRDTQMKRSSGASTAVAGKSSGGGGGGGGGAREVTPSSGRDLARLVSNLNTIEKVQNKGLTAEQKQQLRPVIEAIQKADTLPEAEATAKLEAVKKTLTADQQQMLADLTPQRGGRGGGGGGMGGSGGGMSVSTPGSRGGVGGSGGGKMGGGAQPDPNKPFGSERNKKALEDLIAALK